MKQQPSQAGKKQQPSRTESEITGGKLINLKRDIVQCVLRDLCCVTWTMAWLRK